MFNNLLMGTPDQCLEKVEEYDRAGLDHLSLFSHFGPGHEDYVESMRLFAEGVMKPYRERHAKDVLPQPSTSLKEVLHGGPAR